MSAVIKVASCQQSASTVALTGFKSTTKSDMVRYSFSFILIES